MKNTSTNRGFIKIILIIVVALLVLSYFGFSLRDLVNAPVTQDNFGYVASTTTTFWGKYLKNPATYVWNDVFITLIWNPAVDNIKRLNQGQPDDIQLSQPRLSAPTLMP